MTHSCPTLRSADLQDCQYARSLHARAGAAQMQQRAGKACRPLAPRAWKRLQERGGTGYRTVRVRAGTEDANGAAHMTILSIRIVGRRKRAPGLAARWPAFPAVRRDTGGIGRAPG